MDRRRNFKVRRLWSILTGILTIGLAVGGILTASSIAAPAQCSPALHHRGRSTAGPGETGRVRRKWLVSCEPW